MVVLMVCVFQHGEFSVKPFQNIKLLFVGLMLLACDEARQTRTMDSMNVDMKQVEVDEQDGSFDAIDQMINSADQFTSVDLAYPLNDMLIDSDLSISIQADMDSPQTKT